MTKTKENQEEEEKIDKGVWKDFLKLIKPFHKKLLYLFLFIVLIQGFAVLPPYVLKLIIDKLTVFSPEELKLLVLLVIAYFGLEQITTVINYLRNRLIFRSLFGFEYFLQTKAQEKLVGLPLSYHERENTGNKIIKIDRGTYTIIDLLSNMTWEMVPTLVQLVFTIVVLLFVDYRFSLIVLLVAPVHIYFAYYSNKSVKPLRKDRYKKEEEAAGKMAQSIININTVKSFVQEGREMEEFREMRSYIKRRGIREWFKMIKFFVLRGVLIDLGRLFTLSLAVYLVYKGSITVGSLVFAFTLSEKVFLSLFRMARFYDRFQEGAVAIYRFMTIMNEESNIKNKKDAILPKRLRGDIEFENVSFSYDDKKEKALKNVSLSIKAGEMLALVGPSGGGKTTTARMIYRHYDPLKGSVKIDGIDLRDYDLYAFRKQIAIVPQEAEIFNTSIKENICYARPDASQKEVENAARIANALEFIEKLPDGFETLVGERGVKLSGGQKQRVGIARAIITDPSILIFDEATSNLDSYSESLIQRAMDDIAKDRTVIIIAHRLSTIKKADNIIVLDEGMICERGTHSELSQKESGLYAKLINLQQLGELG